MIKRRPFQYAHYVVSALLVLTIIAFAPTYFVILGDAPVAHHVHGMTATFWLILLILQSWSLSAGRLALHKKAGKALFILVPFFIGGGLLVTQLGAAQYASGQNPFYELYGTRLTLIDVANAAFFGLAIFWALKYRKNIALHSGYMMITLVPLFPPALSRLLPMFVPGMEMTTLEDLPKFEISLFASTIFSTVVLAAMAWRSSFNPAALWVGFVFSAYTTFHVALIPESGFWKEMALAVSMVSPGGVFIIGVGYGMLMCWMGWRAGSKGRTDDMAQQPAAAE